MKWITASVATLTIIAVVGVSPSITLPREKSITCAFGIGVLLFDNS